jgi:hypothetical protein
MPGSMLSTQMHYFISINTFRLHIIIFLSLYQDLIASPKKVTELEKKREKIAQIENRGFM